MRRSRDGGGGAAGSLGEASVSRSAMGRAMGVAGLLVGLLLVPAVLLGGSFGRGEPPPDPQPALSEWETASDAVPEDSLWPLPQSIRTSRLRLQLAPERFQVVHGAGSSAGPACGLLQDAFRR